MSKKIREALWLVLGCVMLAAGIQLTFGTGWALIIGGACFVAGYFLEATTVKGKQNK